MFPVALWQTFFIRYEVEMNENLTLSGLGVNAFIVERVTFTFHTRVVLPDDICLKTGDLIKRGTKV